MKTPKKYIIGLYIVAFMFAALNSYAINITGTIYGDISGEGTTPLVGAKVVLIECEHLAITDDDGKFSIHLHEAQDILKISYIGYLTKEIDVSQGTENLEITLDVDGTIRTDEIVVEDTKYTIINETDLHSTTTLTSHNLRKAACCNLSESFETTTSVDVGYSDAISNAKQIEMLGLKGSYVQLMTDKIPNLRGLASPYGLSYIPGNWLNAIGISKGAASVSAGHESITGQINIDYKKPENNEKLFANLFLRSAGELDFNTNSLIHITDTLKTELFFQTNHNIMELDENDDGFLDMSLNHKYTFMNRWSYHKKNRRAMIGYYIMDESRKGGQLDYLDDESNPDLFGMKFDTRRYEIFGKRAYIFDSPTAYRSFAFIGSTTLHEQNAMFGHRKYSGEHLTGYLNAVYAFATKDDDHVINAGANIEYDKVDENLMDPDNASELNWTPEFVVPGAFVEYTLGAIENLRLSGGIRGDYDLQNEKLYILPRIHAKWEFFPEWYIRASAGRGWRHAYALAENISALASSREIIFDEKIEVEDAWNYGVNFLGNFELFSRSASFSVEYFRTDFTNMLIADYDMSNRQVHFYNLDGESYSNSFQVDFSMTPIKNFTILTAYRYNDVKMTYNDELKQKPLSSPHRAFINFEYNTRNKKWAFDFTANYIGGGRLPYTGDNPVEYQLPENFDSYFLLNTQVTRKFDDLNIYLGCENLGNFTQSNPILAADNPYGENFDSSIIYAPITGRKFYLKFTYEMW